MAAGAKSKRKTFKLKYKIEKKVREHRRKLRKEEKKNALKEQRRPKSSSKNKITIPNSYPFKKQLLEEIQLKKEQVIAEKKERRKQNRLNYKASLLSQDNEFDAKGNQQEEKGVLENKPNEILSLKDDENVAANNRPKTWKTWVDRCDVIFYVLDARDPMGSRCLHVEKHIVSEGKKNLIFILNKVDLVPHEVANSWLHLLRTEFPTIPFQACFEQPKSNEKIFSKKSRKRKLEPSLMVPSNPVAAEMVLQLLKRLASTREMQSLSIGVMGLHRVGLTCFAQSLYHAAHSGKILDFSSDEKVNLGQFAELWKQPCSLLSPAEINTGLLLTHIPSMQQVESPIKEIDTLISRCDKTPFMVKYVLPDFDDAQELIQMMWDRKPKDEKSKSKDEAAEKDQIARDVLSQWLEGCIPFFTNPPSQEDAAEKSVTTASKTALKKNLFPIDVNFIMQSDKLIFAPIRAGVPLKKSAYVKVSPSQPINKD